MNKEGKLVIEPKYYEAQEFINGLAFVRIGTWKELKDAYIDKKGKYRWGPKFPVKMD